MPSEVEQNVDKVSDETKEIENSTIETKEIENSTIETKEIENSTIETKEIENSTIEIKKNGSEEPRPESEVLAPEEFKVTDSENKENEKPTIEDLDETEDIESQKKRAEKLLNDGRRFVIIKDFQAAADVLSTVCNLFGKIYGELAEECAEVYFMYGCALLELSKDQMNPVGLEEKVDDENEDIPAQKDSTDKNDLINNDNKATISVEKVGVADIEMKKSTDDEKIPDNDEEKSTKKDEMLSEDEVSADEEEEKPDEEDDEENDVSDLQLAWEMLDLAKVIYKKMNTEDSKIKLAEVLVKCGEVTIEDEQFETAIRDMTEALEIRRLLLPEDSRIIAETLFQLGIAHELDGSGEKAIELLTEAAAVLDQRIKTLETKSNNLDIDNLSSTLVKEEVAEIKSIIPEINEKIVDIKERKKAAVSALLAAVGVSCEATTNGASSSNKQASNINHLVRKRPKEEVLEGVPKKVPKFEESTSTK